MDRAHPRVFSPLFLAIATLGLGSASSASAADGACDSGSPVRGAPTLNVRIDNDLFAQRDEGYSSGVQVSVVSPNLKDYTDDPCLPALARWINGHLDRIQPEGFDEQNMVVRVSQGIYTPADRERSDLILDDRPYAGVLMVSLGYNARRGDHLRTTQLGIGVVGPHAYAEQTQDFIHGFTRSRRFQGWNNQIKDEVLVSFVHERSQRLAFHPIGNGHLQWDAIGHWGGALGNYQTHANGGFELRLGRDLPNDFGSSPVRPAGDNTAPSKGESAARWSWHGFLATDARLVLRDITLDGNTFRDSHSVDKKTVVGEAAIGAAMTYGAWKIALARYFRTREFDGQDTRPSYGSFTISREF
jgi:lipid A 3-O-deacylase